jgi:hypothetical protein
LAIPNREFKLLQTQEPPDDRVVSPQECSKGHTDGVQQAEKLQQPRENAPGDETGDEISDRTSARLTEKPGQFRPQGSR